MGWLVLSVGYFDIFQVAYLHVRNCYPVFTTLLFRVEELFPEKWDFVLLPNILKPVSDTRHAVDDALATLQQPEKLTFRSTPIMNAEGAAFSPSEPISIDRRT